MQDYRIRDTALAGALPARRATTEFSAGGACPRCPELDARLPRNRNNFQGRSGIIVAHQLMGISETQGYLILKSLKQGSYYLGLQIRVPSMTSFSSVVISSRVENRKVVTCPALVLNPESYCNSEVGNSRGADLHGVLSKKNLPQK